VTTFFVGFLAAAIVLCALITAIDEDHPDVDSFWGGGPAKGD
jgi:hypothetical protein